MTSPSTGAVSPAWSDNVPLDALNSALGAHSTAAAANTQANTSQRFWSTPARPADSPIKEVLEISLSAERLVNTLTFQSSIFPHEIYVEFFDPQLNAWTELISAATATAQPVHETILSSVPATIPPANAVVGHLHPQHSFSGHWQTFSITTRPTYLKKLRLILARTTAGAPPRNTLGQLIDYSLAVNNLTLGYSVASLADVPATRPTPGSFTEYDPFASTSDMLGSAVNYSVRVNKAQNVLQNGSGAANSTLVWKSEPQPFPWAVVNFYVDGRDSDGNPQVIDKFYLEPLFDGANVNLYYSNDSPTSDFVSGNDPLPPNVGVITGPNGPNVLSNDTYGHINFVDVNNSAIGFNPGQSWWLGLDLTFNFTASTDNSNHALFSCAAFTLALTPTGFQVLTAGSDNLLLTTQDFSATTPVRLMLWYDGQVLRLAALINGELLGAQKALAIPLDDTTVPTLRVGGFLGAVPGSGSFNLRSMVLKAHQTPDNDLAVDYLNHPADYAIRPPLALDDDHKTDNAILRYDPASITTDFPSGFLGGPPDHYAEMTWSPIARDFIARKGFLNLPPTKASYWKLEFCNLVPQPYEVYQPIKRTVRTYTTEMWTLRPVVSETLYQSINVRYPGVSVSMMLASTVRYQDQVQARMLPSTGNSTIYTATQARIINDVSVQAKLGSIFWAWNFITWHSGIWCPRFQTVCVHTYQYIDVEQTTKMAFFAGLIKIEAYRLNYLTPEDTGQYVEPFHDLNNISEDANWTLLADHQLSSGDSKYAQIDSNIMPSNKTVRAVQFAATQSLPAQLLPDDDFDDPDFTYWNSVGDGHIAGTQQVATLGSVLTVDRSPHPLDWGSLETMPGTWGGFEAQAFTYRIVETLGNPANESGGIESHLYDTPPGGRVHAAARVVTPKDLSGPLFVQIVDESDRVLSESGTSVRAGQVAEWYTSYTIGEGGEILAHRWGDFASPSALTFFSDSFQHSNAAVLPLMDSGQAWTPATSGSTVLSHSIASFEAVQNASASAIDTFVPDTVWGGLDLTVGAMGTGTQVSLLRFAPFYVTDAGALVYLYGTTSTLPTSVFGRALAAGDKIHIDFMPTKNVPANRRDSTAPVDDVSAPYSMLFYLNGVWTSTLSHRYGQYPLIGIRGRAGQHYRGISWSPAVYDALPGPVIPSHPVATNGGSYDAVGSTWTDNTGGTWAKINNWDNSTNRLTALSDGAEFRVETGYWYGTLHARVHHIATDTTHTPATNRGNVLILDSANGVYVDAYGYLMCQGTAYTRLFPGGIPADSSISVQFADAKQVAYSVRGAIDATATPRMLIARLNGAVVSVWGSPKLGVWTGTVRGLAGAAYFTGVDSDGNPVPLATGLTASDYHTSFDGFCWAPDTSSVSLAPSTPTWDDVTRRGTATYAEASNHQLLEPNRFKARLIQKGLSNDVWEIDTLSLYADPIVWYFSNDGGQNFFPAYDIRNNPHGVLTFPSADPTQPYNPNFGQQLVWRAVSYAPNSTISSLVIRPWYAGLASGITHRVGVFSGDPNVMPYDHYPDLESDARFQTWDLPIPQNWWYSYRILERSKDVPVAQPDVLVLSDSFITDLGASS